MQLWQAIPRLLLEQGVIMAIKYLTSKEVAERLGKSVKTISRYASNGTLAAVRDINSKQLLVSESEVNRYISDHFVDATDTRYIDSDRIKQAHQARGQ